MKKQLLIIISVLLLFTIGFCVYLFLFKPNNCKAFKINMVSQAKIGEEVIYLTDIVAGKETKFKWDFGTGDTTDFSSDTSGTFKFLKEGEFVVSLVINGNNECKQIHKIKIVKGDLDEVENKTIEKGNIGIIEGPKVGEVLVYLDFIDATPDAIDQRWQFGETGEIDSREKQVSYMYTKPGVYTIILTNNLNKKGIKHQITINANRTAPAPNISENLILNKLQLIANGDMEKPYQFVVNLLKDEQIPVEYNGPKGQLIQKFADYCQGLQIQEVEILSLEIERKNPKNQITKMIIKQRKK